MGDREWTHRKLGELTQNLDSRRVPVRRSERRAGRYPYFGASGIIDYVDGFLFDGDYLLVAEDGENLRTRSTPIAFVASGRFWVNNHAHVVLGSELADTRFLMYALAVTDISGYLTGSTQPKLTQESLNEIPIVVPSIEKQRRIAALLGALDDQIELNRRMSKTLEAIARTLFRSMFVEADTSAWGEGTVGSEFDLTMGQSPPGSTYNTSGIGTPLYQGRTDFGFRFPTKRVYTTSPSRVASPGDTLVSVRAPVGDVNRADETCAVGRGVAAVRHKTGSTAYSHYAMLALHRAFDRFNAEGTVFGSVSKKDFAAIRVLVPPEAVIDAFDAVISPIDERVALAQRESTTLAALRDVLLPKLISGELRVGDGPAS